VAELFCSKAQPIQIFYLYILGHCNASSFLSVACCPVPNIFALCTNLILFEGYTYASGCSGVSRTKTRSLWPWHQLSNKSYYLIFSTFLFEIKDGRPSDKILYHHTVVIKEWRDVARDLFCRTTLSWRHIIEMREKTYQNKQRKQIIISKDRISIFPATVRPTVLK